MTNLLLRKGASETGGQVYSNTSSYKVSEYSLAEPILQNLVTIMKTLWYWNFPPDFFQYDSGIIFMELILQAMLCARVMDLISESIQT